MLITIPGKPIAKARPRFYRRSGHVGTYDGQISESGRWFLQAKDQITERFEGPICVNLKFFFARPKSHFGTGKNAGILKKSAPYFHTTKLDIDNCIKFALDVLNGYAYFDDKQIVHLVAAKEYAEPGTERTEIFICRAVE